MNFRHFKHCGMHFIAVLLCTSLAHAQSSVYNEYGGASATSTMNDEAPSRISGCPPVVKTLIDQDKENSLFILNSQFATCQGYLNQDKPGAGIFLDGKNLSAAMSTSVTEFNGSLKGVADACSSNPLTKREDQKEVVSKIYYSQTRLADSERGVVQATATLGAVLGKTDWQKSEKCEAAESQATKALCKQAKDPAQCKATTNVHQLYQQQMQVEDKIGQYNLQKLQLTQQLNSMSRSDPDALAAVHDKIVEADVMIARLKTKIPWVSGPVYQSNVSCSRGSGCHNQEAALAAQLNADYTALQGSYSKLDNASQCLSGNSPYGCQVSDVRDAMELTPENYSANTIPGKGQTIAAVNEHLSEQQCMYEARDAQMTAKSKIQSAMVEAGMGLVTLGAGAAVEGAVWAVREGMMTTRIARAVVTADRAINVASDATGAMVNVNNAVQTCTQQQAVAVKSGATASTDSAKNICAQNPVLNYSPANDQFGDCMDAMLQVLPPGQVAKAGLKVAQTVGTGVKATARALGYTQSDTPAARTYFKAAQNFSAATGTASVTQAKTAMLESASELSVADRWAAAEAVTGTPLTPMQKLAIVDAHDVGAAAGHGFSGDGSTYTLAELRKKVEILKAAGFKQDEIDKMMRTGITGALDGTHLAGGYEGVAKQIKKNTENSKDANDLRLRAGAQATLKEAPAEVQKTFGRSAAAFAGTYKLDLPPGAPSIPKDLLERMNNMSRADVSNALESMAKSGDAKYSDQIAALIKNSIRQEMTFNGVMRKEFKQMIEVPGMQAGMTIPKKASEVYVEQRLSQELEQVPPAMRNAVQEAFRKFERQDSTSKY